MLLPKSQLTCVSKTSALQTWAGHPPPLQLTFISEAALLATGLWSFGLWLLLRFWLAKYGGLSSPGAQITPSAQLHVGKSLWSQGGRRWPELTWTAPPLHRACLHLCTPPSSEAFKPNQQPFRVKHLRGGKGAASGFASNNWPSVSPSGGAGTQHRIHFKWGWRSIPPLCEKNCFILHSDFLTVWLTSGSFDESTAFYLESRRADITCHLRGVQRVCPSIGHRCH